MASRLPEIRVLLVGAFDDALHAHAALRRRALERLGCRVTTLNLIGTGGWLTRLRRVGLHDRLARTIVGTAPALVLVLEGTQVDAAMVASLREGAADYLLKDRLGRLPDAVRRALADRESRQRQRQAE